MSAGSGGAIQIPVELWQGVWKLLPKDYEPFAWASIREDADQTFEATMATIEDKLKADRASDFFYISRIKPVLKKIKKSGKPQGWLAREYLENDDDEDIMIAPLGSAEWFAIIYAMETKNPVGADVDFVKVQGDLSILEKLTKALAKS